MKPYLVLLFVAFTFTVCNSQSAKIKTIEATEFAKQLKSNPNAQLLDVRTPKEFNDQHLQNAINMNWNDAAFAENTGALDKSEPVYVYCLSGGRSNKAANKLKELGFSDVIEMEGGIMKWNAAGLSKPTTNTGMTKADFDKLLVSDKKVLINFYADWCAPCKKMTPFVTKMQSDLADDVTIIRIDADTNKTLALELEIESLPTLLLYNKQALQWKQEGFISEEDLTKKL